MLLTAVCPCDFKFTVADNAVLGSLIDSYFSACDILLNVHIAVRLECNNIIGQVISGRSGNFSDVILLIGQRDRTCSVSAYCDLTDLVFAVLIGVNSVDRLSAINWTYTADFYRTIGTQHLCDAEFYIRFCDAESVHIHCR